MTSRTQFTCTHIISSGQKEVRQTGRP